MQLDTSAFSRPLTAEERRLPIDDPRFFFQVLMAVGLVAFGLLGIGIIAGNPSASGFVWVMPIVLLTAGVALIWYLILRRQRILRLAVFARDNGFERIPSLKDPPHTGWLFERGRARKAFNVMRRSGAKPIEIGTYEYTTGSGKSQRTHTFGYVRIPLIAPLPHVFADCKNSGTSSNVVGELPKGETIKLPNNRVVSLHAPPGYEQDGKALFQPAELELLTGEDPILDAETVGTDLYLYMREHTWIGALGWQRLNAVLAGLEPTIRRWAEWRDLRPAAMPQEEAASVPAPMPFAAAGGDGWYMPPGVAPQGRRMRRRTNVWVWVLTTLFLLLFFAVQFAGSR